MFEVIVSVMKADCLISILFLSQLQPAFGGLGRFCCNTSCKYSALIITVLKNIGGNLVLTAETGHNWGSDHDTPGPCAPSDDDGGRYIMYEQSVHGYQPNHFVWLTCSFGHIHVCFNLRLLVIFYASTYQFLLHFF